MTGFHVLAVLSCLVTLSQCRTTVSHKKREWPIKLCVSDDDCNGGCCKGLFCFRYLSEGERCLFGHRLRAGCGCEESLECEKKSLPWDHTCTKKSTIEEVSPSSPSTLEVLNRELENFIEQDQQNTALTEDDDSATVFDKKKAVNSTDVS